MKQGEKTAQRGKACEDELLKGASIDLALGCSKKSEGKGKGYGRLDSTCIPCVFV